MASTTTQQSAATAAATTPATAAAGAPAATAAAAPVSAQSSASLYVGDLDPQVTEALLFEIFNPIGPVASIRVCRDSTTRRSLGYAYVNFHMMVDAERALDTLNYQAIRGRACRIMWSHRDPAIRKSGVGNIFIKNLDKAIDHKALYDTFSAFGNILSCKVQTDDQGNSLGYGFVHYETAEAAEEAINRVNGMLLNEKKVFVGPFKSRKERPDAAAGKFTNCYVKNIPLEWDEDKFKEVFGECGEVRSLVIMKDADDNSRGFGFVDFSEPEQAQEAIAKYNDTVPEGAEKSMYVSRAQKRSERDQFLRRRFEQIRQERVSKYQGVNLYVKNLADDLNDDELRAAFAEYGTITSAKIMVDDKQNSKGFGFVCFTTPEEATLAVTEKNGKMVKGKPIYVALAQRKEVRRAQLEAQHAQRSRAPMVYQAPPYFAGPGGMQARQPFVYANPQNPRQMMAAPRWVNPAQGGGRGAYQAYPQQMRGGGRGGRGGGSGRGRGRGGQAISYTDAARNQGRMPVPAQQQAQPAQQPAKQGGGAEPLTTNRLASASPEHQKQILGERLYPLIAQQQPELAGKITGMLLEMDNAELLHLIESRDALNEKVNEAVAVLAAHAQAAAEAEAANQVFLLH